MIYADYIDTLIVENNLMQNGAATGAQYGIYILNSAANPCDYVRIRKNNLQLNSSSTMYGIYVSYISSGSSQRSEISNNMISNSGTGGTALRYALYLNGANNIDIVHNSISFLDGGPTNARALFLTGTASFGVTNTVVRNNIFTHFGQGYALYIAPNAISATNTIDNNVYYSTVQPSFYYSSADYNTFADYQAASIYDANSLFGDPLFGGPNDLHVFGSIANDVGATIPFITDDIDGDARPMAPSTSVDIGADEYTPSSCLPVGSVSAGPISYDNATITWFPNGTETQWIVEVVPTGTTPTGTGITAGSPSQVVPGLSGSTTYDVYVYPICSGVTGPASGIYSFTSACNPLIAPWVDDVEAFTAVTGVWTEANCWTHPTPSGTTTYDWNIDAAASTPSANTGPSGANSGVKYFYIEGNYTDIELYAILLSLDLIIY